MARRESFPLQWPSGQPRTKLPERGRFSTSLGNARDGLYWELEALGATDVVITSNLELKRDGRPYARQPRLSEDQGVAVYFTLPDGERCMAVDKFLTIADNMQALRKSVEALRGLERWGGAHIVNAAFRGFEALSPGGREWWVVLGVRKDDPWPVIADQRRKLVFALHPDKGGTNEQWLELESAWREAQQYAKGIR